jgi:hypothetical protein
MREEACNQLFYNKLFPLISITNGFTKSAYKAIDEVTAGVGSSRRMESIGVETQMMNLDDYIIPTIEWDKKLMPEGDEEQLNILEKLEEKGIPLSLRSWAAAGGIDLDLLIKQREASIDDEIALKQLEKKRQKAFSEAGVEDSGGEGGGFDDDDDSFMSSVRRRSSLPEVPLLARKFRDSDFELFTQSATGKRQFKVNQERAHKNANLVIAATLQRMSVEKGGKPKKYMLSGKKNEVTS